MKDRNKMMGDDDRLRKEADPGRIDRAVEDVVRVESDGTVLTREERMRMIRSEWKNEALPSPPDLKDWHLCWLTTTSNYDPLSKRLRMGYQLVRKAELPGFTPENNQPVPTQFADYITCNEMVLAKLPMELYQDIMMEFHHNMPLEEEEAIKARMRENMSDEDSDGRQLLEEDEGFKTLVQRRKAPSGFE